VLAQVRGFGLVLSQTYHRASTIPGGWGQSHQFIRTAAGRRSVYGFLILLGHSERKPTKEELPMTETKRPDYAAYVVRDRDDKKSNWREIGVAFAHRDGKGIDLLLDAVPVSGRVVLRTIEDKAE
jgi:hypothetical protein